MEIGGAYSPADMQDCQKSLAEFAADAANSVQIVFGRGVYVDKNTSQAASVEFVCLLKGDPIKRKRALWGEEIPGDRWNFPLAGNETLCLVYRRYARSRLQKLAESPAGDFRQAQRTGLSRSFFNQTAVTNRAARPGECQ